MTATEPLPLPHLSLCEEEGLSLLIDGALRRAVGVCVAFAGRAGGVSEGAYAGLNLGGHVGDDPACVQENRQLLMRALGAGDAELIMLNQVHGTDVVSVESTDAASLEEARLAGQKGADALVVGVPQVAALLCFADCVPVIVVSPTGRFAVAHAGWRGAVAGVAFAAVRALAAADAQDASAASYNAYIGPCIRSECFECGADVAQVFAERYGRACVPDARHVDLPAAVTADLVRAGVDVCRVCDAGVCTVCGSDQWFSYRASGGTCGRHGAFACRTEEDSSKVVSYGSR